MRRRPAETATRNFIDKYGVEALETMLRGLKEGRTLQSLADEIGVSKERVRQWRELMGESTRTYVVYPDLQKYL